MAIGARLYKFAVLFFLPWLPPIVHLDRLQHRRNPKLNKAGILNATDRIKVPFLNLYSCGIANRYDSVDLSAGLRLLHTLKSSSGAVVDHSWFPEKETGSFVLAFLE